MKLYHFTCHLWWHFIKVDGIARSEAPIALGRAINWPNLTENGDRSAQGWVAGSAINKRAVRITVEIAEGDDRLISWRAYTREHGMSHKDYRTYDRTGGWQSRNWWIYRGVIAPDRFTAVDFSGDPTAFEEVSLLGAEEATDYSDYCRRLGYSGPEYTAGLGESFSH